MKKFFVKALLVLLPILLVWAFIWICPLWYVDEVIPFHIWNRKTVRAKTSLDYDVIILGDSTANGDYLPLVLSEKTINLSLAGNSPVESYYILEEYLKYNRAPKVCYISYVQFHFGETECFWSFTMYSHRFDIFQESRILADAKKFDDESIIKNYLTKNRWLYRFRSPSIYVPAIKLAGYQERYKANKQKLENVKMQNGTFISYKTDKYKNLDDSSEYENFTMLPLYEKYYRKMIELCIANNIQVRLVKLPLASYWKFSQQYFEEFCNFMIKLKDAFPEISVDWIDDGFSDDEFFDTEHMNIYGAVKFSDKIRKMYPQDFVYNATLSEQTLRGIQMYKEMAKDNPETIAILDAYLEEYAK